MNYLDNAATTFPKPNAVYDAMDAFARTSLGNPGRSGHALSRASEKIIDEARVRLARLIHANSPSRIVLTLNGTDSLNIAIKGWVRPGDHVVTGLLEHNSVLRPLVGIGAEVTRIPFDAEGYYRTADVAEAIQPNTRLVVLTHGSNVLGTIQPVSEIGRLCRDRRIPFLVDAAQTAGSIPIDVKEMSIDLLAAPGHKSLFGPVGTGFLYVSPNVELHCWREGGTGGDSGSATQPSGLPQRLEAGTPNVLGLAGLVEGLKFIETMGSAALVEQESRWRSRLLAGLKSISGVTLLPHGEAGDGLPLASFQVKGYGSQEVASILDSTFSVAVRGGLHCAPLVHDSLGTSPEGAVRVSGSALSMMEDLEKFLEVVDSIAG
jgi:cysteine desulfurase family protein